MEILQSNTESFLTKYLLPFGVLIATYFAPTVYWVSAIGFFIVSDLVLRILLCLKNNVPVVSEKMWRTVYKFGVGIVFILVAHVSQRLFVPDIPIMKILGSFLILVELKSIDEKAKEATGYSLFSLIVDKLMPKKNA